MSILKVTASLTYKIFIFITLLSCFNHAYADNTLYVRTADYPPNCFYNPKTQKWDGLNIDILNALSKRTGQKIKYIEIPRKRAFALIESGSLDVMLNLTQTNEREKIFDFIGLSSYEEMTLVVKEENRNTPIGSLDDFIKHKKTIGVVDSYYYPQLSEKMKNDPDFKKKAISEEVIRSKLLSVLLKRESFFGFFEDKLHVIDAIKNNPYYEGLAIHEFSLNEPQVVHIAFSRKVDKSIRDAFRKAHQELTKEGIIDKILDKWAK